MLASISIVLWLVLEKALSCSRSVGLGAPTSRRSCKTSSVICTRRNRCSQIIFHLPPTQPPNGSKAPSLASNLVAVSPGERRSQSLPGSLQKVVYLLLPCFSAFAAETNGWLLPLHHRPNSRPRSEPVKKGESFYRGARDKHAKEILPAAWPAVPGSHRARGAK